MKSVQAALGNYYPVLAATLVLGISSGLAGFSLAEEGQAKNPPDIQKPEVQAETPKEIPQTSLFDKLLSEYAEKQSDVSGEKPQREPAGQSIIDRAQAELAASAPEKSENTAVKETKEPVKVAAKVSTEQKTDAPAVLIKENTKSVSVPVPADSVWATVKPNEHTIEKPVKQETKPEIKKEETKEEVKNTSVWDAVPVTVAQDGTTFAEARTDVKPQTAENTQKTAEEIISEPVKIAEKIETIKIEAVNPAEKEVAKEEKKTEEKKAEPLKEKETKKDELAALLAEPVKEDSSKQTENGSKETKQSETAQTVSEIGKKNEIAEEDSKKADSKKETAKGKETVKEEVKKEIADNKTDNKTESKSDDGRKKEEAKEVKEVLVKENIAPKTSEMLNDLEKKNLAEKQELEEVAETKVQKEPQRLPVPTVPDFDDDIEDTTARHSLIDGNKVGDPNAKDKIKLMYDEIVNGLKSRSMTGKYEMWKNYARSTLRSTSGLNTGSEVDGRCRLTWYTQLYNEPIFSVFAVEEFSRQLHAGLSGNHRQLAEIMSMIRKKLDVPGRNDTGIRFPKCENCFDAINEVKRCLLEAQMSHARAMSTISSNDQKTLAEDLYPNFSGPGVINGHTIPNRTYGRKLVNILETIDKSAMHAAADALLPLTNKALLSLLDELPEDAFPSVRINGQQVQRIITSAGDIIIGGRGNNIYDLDSPEMKNVVCVIDLGGNDLYRDGTCNLDRPVFVIIDLHGNDTYTGSNPGIQGGSILGVSLLVDAEGNDNYSAADVAQGSSIGGIGILLDFGGDDSYKGLKRVQGHALCGVGVLCDYAGADKYRASLWAQGFGAPGGFGVLNDVSGDDHYYCGGIYLDSYPEHPGYDGWGQGIGAGIRQVANGGIGAFLEGSGDDVYEVDYFGHGGGYWLGVGFARDFGGNDIRHGTTKAMYDGSPRRETEWTRFANGFGCHYSLGYLFDDNGNDTYGGRIMGTGMAWDLSIGYLCDFNGSDKFTATGGMTQGIGAEGSIGILFSYGGDDSFLGRNQAYASSNITYHSASNCGSNFSFLINYGGNDQYGCGAKNNSYAQRGSAGGFLIDRPTEEEEKAELAKLKTLSEERQKEIADWDAEQEKLKEEAAQKNRRYVQRTRRPQPITVDTEKRVSPVPSFDTVQTDSIGNKKETKTGNTGNTVR